VGRWVPMLRTHAPWTFGLMGIGSVVAGLLAPGWLSVVLVAVGALVAIVALVVSLRHWTTPPPTTPEGRQAEARLWSTRVGDSY
jgi:hypothetical protein